jgi:hypothetical protein
MQTSVKRIVKDARKRSPFGRTRNGRSRGFVRGVVASVAGLVAMDVYWRVLERIEARSETKQASEQSGGAGEGPLDDVSVTGEHPREGESSTEAVARIAHRKLTGKQPSKETRKRLGQAVHWGYGIAVGGLYGALRPDRHDYELPTGLGYGTALWLLGDEVAVPLLGLAKGPTAHPPRGHAQALGAHLVYGLATSAATKALRRVM